jgi:hypothetical protein
MTDEQRIERRKWLDENFKDNMICNNKKSEEDGTHYVFISYKSDDWEKALKDIVYPLVKDYGLNVYFDREFENNNDNWIKQFTGNMKNKYCKGLIAFYGNRYKSSYATVMELLYSQTEEASSDYREGNEKCKGGLPVVFVDLDDGVIINKSADTGLGKDDFNKRKNFNAQEEKEAFISYFEELVSKKDINIYDYTWKYKNKKSSEILLDVAGCSKIADKIREYKGTNDKNVRELLIQNIVHSIEDACGSEVFSNVDNNQKAKGAVVEQTMSKLENDTVKNATEVSEDVHTKNIEAQNNNQGYTYTIFGKEYNTAVQADLMYDAFEALTNKNPEYARMSTAAKCVSKAEDVTDANTKNAKPSYFRACKSFNINGEEYLVGTSYSIYSKLVEIRNMFKECNEDANEFKVNGELLGNINSANWESIINKKFSRNKI